MASARVHSMQALRDMKVAVTEFAESVNRTLTSVDADINRISQWLSQDRPAYWKLQVRKREEALAKIQGDIMRKKIIAAPEPASIVEEQKALEKAKRRVESAQRKLEAVRRWAPVWEREALLYKTACRGVTEAIHRDMPAAAVRLDSLIRSLDEYLKVAVPRTDDEIAPSGLEQQPEGEHGSPDRPAESPAPESPP